MYGYDLTLYSITHVCVLTLKAQDKLLPFGAVVMTAIIFIVISMTETIPQELDDVTKEALDKNYTVEKICIKSKPKSVSVRGHKRNTPPTLNEMK